LKSLRISPFPDFYFLPIGHPLTSDASNINTLCTKENSMQARKSLKQQPQHIRIIGKFPNYLKGEIQIIP